MTAPDQGGEAPCFAHLLDQLPQQTDQALAELLRQLADAVVIPERLCARHWAGYRQTMATGHT